MDLHTAGFKLHTQLKIYLPVFVGALILRSDKGSDASGSVVSFSVSPE